MPRILRTPWTNQPPRAVGIDRNDLIGRHVLVAVADGVDVASDRPLLTAGAGLTRGVGAHGAQVSHASTSGSTDAIYTPQSHFGPMTIFALSALKATTAASIVSTGGLVTSWGAGGIGFKTSISGSPYFRLIASTSASTAVVATSSVAADAKWHFVVGTWDGSSAIKLYVDGVSVASASGATTLYTASDNFVIGNFASGNLDGAVALSGVLNRALSAAEVAEFSRNPWRIMVPTPQRVYFDLGAGGGDLNITALIGTASATGYAATVDRQSTIAASLGTATAQGYGATVNRSRDIAASLGTATASGHGATVNRQRDIAASLGTATAQGYGASISFGNDLNIAASLGIASADGYQANVNLQRDIAASLGTAAALGYQASISDTDPLHGFTQDQLDFLVAYMEANMAIPTAAEIATAIYANTIDGKTLTQHIRLLSAVLGGKVSGAGTGTETFRDIADTKDRVVVTVDSSGNRTAITLDLT